MATAIISTPSVCPCALDGVWKMPLLLHPSNIDHHKSCWSSNNKTEHKEFQKFLPPSNKNIRALTSETEGPIKDIEMQKFSKICFDNKQLLR